MHGREIAEAGPLHTSRAPPGTDRAAPPSDLLRLQATAGNRAATAYLQRQRLTGSRIPAPTAIVHESRQLTPDFE